MEQSDRCRTRPSSRWNPSVRSSTTSGETMNSYPIEWGPAHLRDDAVTPAAEPSERPDDN
ncbi:hypothetical protein GCM10008944_28520 [Cytobacillus oceanisediminis]